MSSELTFVVGKLGGLLVRNLLWHNPEVVERRAQPYEQLAHLTSLEETKIGELERYASALRKAWEFAWDCEFDRYEEPRLDLLEALPFVLRSCTPESVKNFATLVRNVLPRDRTYEYTGPLEAEVDQILKELE